MSGQLSKEAKEYMGRKSEHRGVVTELQTILENLVAKGDEIKAEGQEYSGQHEILIGPLQGDLWDLLPSIIQEHKSAQARITELEAENARYLEVLDQLYESMQTTAQETEGFVTVVFDYDVVGLVEATKKDVKE